MESEHCYIAIDMKSFYASVECVARGDDPLTTNLLVADESPLGSDDLSGRLSFPQSHRRSLPAPPV